MTSIPLPPADLIELVGGGDFAQIGANWLSRLVRFGGLRPADRVLDVGCGAGRIAIPLMEYLDVAGAYEGFDVVPEAVDWCRAHISSRDARFRFQHADLLNGAYNPAGRGRAREFRFPYEDGTFDFAFATSVFTHLLPPEAERYMGEIRRVMKPGGRCLVTFFLLNDESQHLLLAGRSSRAFPCDHGSYCTQSPEKPEAAVAYEEDYVLGLYARSGLEAGPVYHGGWCGRREAPAGQDFIVAFRS